MRHAFAILFPLVLLAAPLQAQQTSEVKFRAGDYGAMVRGTVTGRNYIDYKLGAAAGQEMFVELTVAETDGDGNVNFNILRPGSTDVALYNSSMDGNTTTVDLPDTGDYTIRVYLMGNDEDAGKTVSFNMDLSIQ